MLKKLLFLFLVFISAFSFSQVVNGIVYDDETSVRGVKILNITKKIITATNANGEFTLKADVSDTLSFQSVFYKPVQVVVKPQYFEGTNVFELQKIINKLDEINIKNKPKEKLFGEKAFNANMKEIIALDKKKEPQKYNAAPKYGLDFIQVAKLIGKLFKKKRKPIPNTLKYNQYKLLFAENNFFTKKLLTEDLKIQEQYHSLFFEFLEEKAIPEVKLDYSKRLQLLNDFTMYSQEFMIIVEMAEERIKD
ncbi:MAG: hypothetical protein HKP48_08460 [Winogradskyella sp.]|uniref:hypothetical protein n=1 Tax=Winogradskyella sp. TaxID=1883156 RepID=UPI0017BF0658|nr:hypothetical protein [Winogradskyella sp.]MBT8244381.1 carboxypeptidase-like regulatory domain-containing protein [Winogradskyella sp.]NNK23306.1 hypothetical protein [Winogradskyella sp.]